jgi:hypothetical protein
MRLPAPTTTPTRVRDRLHARAPRSTGVRGAIRSCELMPPPYGGFNTVCGTSRDTATPWSYERGDKTSASTRIGVVDSTSTICSGAVVRPFARSNFSALLSVRVVMRTVSRTGTSPASLA